MDKCSACGADDVFWVDGPCKHCGGHVPTAPRAIAFGYVWWRSVWPLFAVSMALSAALGNFVGVGGCGAVVVGSFLAHDFAKRPVSGLWPLFRAALSSSLAFSVIGGLLESGRQVEWFIRRGHSKTDARILTAVCVALSAALMTMFIAGVWAVAIHLKTRRLFATTALAQARTDPGGS